MEHCEGICNSQSSAVSQSDNQILRIKQKLRGSYLSAEFLSEKKARNQIKCHFYNKVNESEILKETDRFSRRDRIE